MMPLNLSQQDKQRTEHYRKLIEQAVSIDDIINELQKETLEFLKKRPQFLDLTNLLQQYRILDLQFGE